MNYFSLHIGDYMRDAAHLSNLEHGIYLRILITYYRDEGPKTADQFARAVAARSPEERQMVDDILQEFFQEQDGLWHHKRCDREIQIARVKAARAAENGGKGGRPVKATQKPEGTQPQPNNNPEITPGFHDGNLNETEEEPECRFQEPSGKLPNNQEPKAIGLTTTAHEREGTQEPPWWQDDPDRVAAEMGRVLSLFPPSWGGDDLTADEPSVRRLAATAREWAAKLGEEADQAILSSLAMFEDTNGEVIRTQKVKGHSVKPWVAQLRSWFEGGRDRWKPAPERSAAPRGFPSRPLSRAEERAIHAEKLKAQIAGGAFGAA